MFSCAGQPLRRERLHIDANGKWFRRWYFCTQSWFFHSIPTIRFFLKFRSSSRRVPRSDSVFRWMSSSMRRPVSTDWFCTPFREIFQPGARLPTWRYALHQPAVFSATGRVCWSISPMLHLCRQPARFCWKTDRPSSAAAGGKGKRGKLFSHMPGHCPAAYNMFSMSGGSYFDSPKKTAAAGFLF